MFLNFCITLSGFHIKVGRPYFEAWERFLTRKYCGFPVTIPSIFSKECAKFTVVFGSEEIIILLLQNLRWIVLYDVDENKEITLPFNSIGGVALSFITESFRHQPSLFFWLSLNCFCTLPLNFTINILHITHWLL
uniref:Uncharacterized protein n=1 Tax=Opuntia streptacantha TaxID=393608 RepID=A0A7C9DXA3_OPUST